MKRIDLMMTSDQYKLLDDVLESLTDKQLDILRDRIIEICNDNPLDMINISYADLVSDLFFTEAGDEYRSFDKIPDTDIINFIKQNEKEHHGSSTY